MKFTLPYLRRGDRVSAQIVEKITALEYIANFNGDLIRITNGTGRSLKTGDKIQLEVLSADPLRFRMVEGSRPAKLMA